MSARQDAKRAWLRTLSRDELDALAATGRPPDDHPAMPIGWILTEQRLRDELREWYAQQPKSSALELFLADGRSAGVFFCPQCFVVGRNREIVEECCAPKVCTRCGVEFPRNWLGNTCSRCQGVDFEERLQRAWDAAPKIDGDAWDGPIVTDHGEGSGDGYWSDLDSLRDWLEEEDLTLADVRCYATQPIKMRMDADAIVEWSLDDHYEGAYDDISDTAKAELQALLDAWCEKHGVTSHVEDNRRALEFSEVVSAQADLAAAASTMAATADELRKASSMLDELSDAVSTQTEDPA